MTLDDAGIYNALCVLIALAAGGYLLWFVVAALRRGRPGLAIGGAVVAAFGARLGAALALDQVGSGQELRGGDETTFIFRARGVNLSSIGSDESVEALTEQLHVFLISLHLRVFDPEPPLLMLRVEMITFAVIGMALITAAVYELAGPRAASVTAWILALEPAGVFFAGLLHKEPLMFLAEGAVVYGGAVLWKRGKLWALVPIVFGCLVATATRPYVGWFLAAAAVAVVLHASITRQQGMRALVLGALTVVLIVLFIPVVLEASSDKNLKDLQASQDANAANEEANLSLERVDYSTREKLITNLPQRITDVIFKPYPWQTQNASQRLGVFGTLVVLTTLFLLIGALWRNGRTVMQRAGPLVYPAIFMLVAYSLSAGNAGTAFRYRTHVVVIAIALVMVLREQRQIEQAAAARIVRSGRKSPQPAARLAK